MNETGQAACRDGPDMEKEKPKKKRRYWLRFFIKCICIAGIAFLIWQFVCEVHYCTGNQMFPAVRDGDLGFFYKLDDITVNDIIWCQSPDGWKTGRVIAKGGSTVDMETTGGFTVDGHTLSETITYQTFPAEDGVDFPVTLKEDEYFILNDFRNDTSDSRTYGTISADDVKGRLIFLMRRRGF